MIFKLFKPAFRLNSRKFLFSHRVVDLWKGLLSKIVACNSTNGFRQSLDKYMKGFRLLSLTYTILYLVVAYDSDLALTIVSSSISDADGLITLDYYNTKSQHRERAIIPSSICSVLLQCFYTK